MLEFILGVRWLFTLLAACGALTLIVIATQQARLDKQSNAFYATCGAILMSLITFGIVPR